MLRLKTLLFRTPTSRHESKRKHPCISKVTRSTLAIDESGLFLLMHGKSVDLKTIRDHKKSEGPYLQLAKMFYDDDAGKKMTNPKCFVWCQCGDFKFRCETALAIRGSSAIINSNGALPKFTNPNARPQVCKHLLSFLEKCVQYVSTHKPSGQDKSPKMVKSDRELVESLTTTRTTRPDIKRMFKSHFASAGISATRF